LPVQTVLPKLPPFNATEIQLIDKEVNELLQKGAINRVSPCQGEFISNLFLVPKKTGDTRPVINLKPLNEFIQNIHFKMENIQMALNLITKGDYMISIDLKDAYFNIPIFAPHRKYLRFIWKDQRYEFTCLPFGYSLAPRVFTKVLKPIISHLRLNGLKIVIFFFFLLLIASSRQECLDQLAFLRRLFEDLGFTVNDKKSQLEPTTKITFLGFIIDSVFMKLFLPDEKVQKIVRACSGLISDQRPTVRQVAHVTGLLVSAFPAVNYLRIYYRSLELSKSQAISINDNFDHHMSLNLQTVTDLNWVVHNLPKYNGHYFGPRPHGVVIEADASLLGWGATCNSEPAQGQWSPLEASHHINYLELLAAFYALQTFVHNEKHIYVQLKLDNSTAISYINNMGGIKSTLLNSLARQLWEWCMPRDIFVSAQHIPGKLNSTADKLSRNFSPNLEWSLNTTVFEQLVGHTLVPDIDLFASNLNTKVKRFVSWYPEPAAEAVNAFSISWSNLKCYAFPPFSVLPQVLRKIREDHALMLLIAPVWSTQSWYPLLLQLLTAEPILLPKTDNLLSLPQSKYPHPMRDNLVLAAWMLSGNLLDTEAFLMKQPTSLLHLGLRGQIGNTTQPGKNGVAGVNRGKLIYFKHL